MIAGAIAEQKHHKIRHA